MTKKHKRKSKVESVVFYFMQSSRTSLDMRWYVGCFEIPGVGFVRFEVVPLSAEDALERADPNVGESVMNTHELRPLS